LQLGLALSASDHTATTATTSFNSNEDTYLASIPDTELEERATEERSGGSSALQSCEQWETVDFPVRRSFS
jgi:hypothetical protein